MKFNGQSSVEVHPHSNLEELKTVTSISLFMRVDPDKDPIEDRFILYLGDKNVRGNKVCYSGSWVTWKQIPTGENGGYKWGPLRQVKELVYVSKKLLLSEEGRGWVYGTRSASETPQTGSKRPRAKMKGREQLVDMNSLLWSWRERLWKRTFKRSPRDACDNSACVRLRVEVHLHKYH